MVYVGPRRRHQSFLCWSERQPEKESTGKGVETRPRETSDEQCRPTHPKPQPLRFISRKSVKHAMHKTTFPEILLTTCHRPPPFLAHRIGSAGTGKDSRAAGYDILGDAVDSQLLGLDAHCRCPDYVDWLATAGGVCYRGAHFPARNHPWSHHVAVLGLMLVASVLGTVEQLLAIGAPRLVALLLVLVVSAVAAGIVKGACGVNKGRKAHLLVLLILCELLRLILLLLSCLLSLGCRLGKLCLRMHLLYLCEIGVPEVVSPIDELALFGAPT